MVWPPRSAGQAGVLGHLIGEVLGPIEVVVGGRGIEWQGVSGVWDVGRSQETAIRDSDGV